MRFATGLAGLVVMLVACGSASDSPATSQTTTSPTTENESTTMPTGEQQQLPIVAPANEHNALYLSTKRTKLGHALPDAP